MANQIKLQNFSSMLTGHLDQMLISQSLSDLTLVCDDGQLQAHKLILAASSSFFSSLFESDHSSFCHPVIFLRGIPCHQMELILSFVYRGETCVASDDLNTFLELAADLKVRGLSNKQENPQTKMITNTRTDEQRIINKTSNLISFDENNIMRHDKIPQDEMNLKKCDQVSHKARRRNREKDSSVLVQCPMCNMTELDTSIKNHMRARRDVKCKNCDLFFRNCLSLNAHRRSRCRNLKASSKGGIQKSSHSILELNNVSKSLAQKNDNTNARKNLKHKKIVEEEPHPIETSVIEEDTPQLFEADFQDLSQSNSITESSDTVEVFQDNKNCYKPELERGKERDYIDQKKTKIKELKNSNCHSAKVHHQTQ